MDAPGEDGRFQKFYKGQQAARGHSFHMHNLLSTYRAHIRGTNRWVTIIDKGGLTALDNAEVRALAASYGSADEVLEEAWVPDFSGITAPGYYMTDYAQDPWKYG